MERSLSTLSSLSRFKLADEHLIIDDLVKKEISNAFNENRCFEFTPDRKIISKIKDGQSLDSYNEHFIAIKNNIFDIISEGNYNLRGRLLNDTRLSSRIASGIKFVYKALAEGQYTTLQDRRFILIKERLESPTIYHISDKTTVISHVGAGPEWEEIPSIYLGLNIFDTLTYEQRRKEDDLFKSFIQLLSIEERAVETGYSHTEIFSPAVSRALNHLVNEVIRVSTLEKIEYKEIPGIVKVRRFTDKKRQELLRMLDARMPNDEFNFNYKKNIEAIESLERLSRRYKKGRDTGSLREVIKLLVAASGHDIHDIRNRANILLERIFSPKEFDAPLATNFINLKTASYHKFEFDLPQKKSGYFIRIYENSIDDKIFTEDDINFFDIDITLDDDSKLYTTIHLFDRCGHFDFLVYRKKRKEIEWINHPGTSGRINVIPNLNGEIILEIFPDIHGHTRVYWNDESGHQGLVYNENGEIIQLGKFSDILFHLEDLKNRYSITALYLLGVQKRGSNREDWAPEATSASPFSPLSLFKIEDSLGGDAEFIKLVKKAHSLDIKVIVDIIPHLNRRSKELPDEYSVKCYNGGGDLVIRASTDGRYGSWNDGKLLNYRFFEIWEWLTESICTLIEKFDIDGIRFDSAHAVPIMMKKNNYQHNNGRKRSHEEMVLGNIVVNDREDDHFITTGFYDCACRDLIGVPLHYYIMQNIEKKTREKKKDFFINIAECYWGHERFLAKTGIIPYNSALYKICENIIHGKSDVREIYHIYDNYFPAVLPEGTELLGILGNHDERRALNTFGQRGLRAAVGLTIFMSNIIMDYEGSAEGESWKVFLDNIYVNWNQFEYVSHRSVDGFYNEWYRFYKTTAPKGYLIWANNVMVAAAIRFFESGFWIGAFNFADSNQNISLQFDNPNLPIPDEACYKVVDPVYSQITGRHNYYTGKELKSSKINTFVSYTERVKLLKLEKIEDIENYYQDFLKDSFIRLCHISDVENFNSSFAFTEIISHSNNFERFSEFIITHLVPIFWEDNQELLELGLKRSLYHIHKNGFNHKENYLRYMDNLLSHSNKTLKSIGEYLKSNNIKGSLVFLSAEAVPFSKSGGLANVVYELPRELVKQGEEVYVITGYYKYGDDKSINRMNDAVKKYKVEYTGRNVKFKIQDMEYEVGVHTALVDGVRYFLLEHYEFFDGLYWGITSEEKLRRRIAFARASIETIICFELEPQYTFSNDAFAGIFNGIIRSDPYYCYNPNFIKNTFLHIIHNGGWQYFDAFNAYEKEFNLFELFNLPMWRLAEFCDPNYPDRINCMATGIRFADKVLTVSQSYAKQIEYACDGLEALLYNVIGISNAIGNDFRSRAHQNLKRSGFVKKHIEHLLETIKTDDYLREKIEERYPEILNGFKDIKNIEDPKRRYILERTIYKMMLQIQKGFKVDPDIILLSMIHRISEQKGFQLLLDSSEGIFKHMDCQVVIGGAVSSGDNRGEEIAHGLYLLSQYYPDKISVVFGFLDVSVPLLASDLFCMPSMNEPGGISQLEAFACGCPVVARATGGLRDTVFPIRTKGDDVEGNGFLFSDFNAWAFYDAISRAMDFFKNSNDDIIYKVRKNAENSVTYWDNPGKKYIEEIYNIKEIIRII